MKTKTAYTFLPAGEFSATDNIEAFVTSCREMLTAFGSDLDFNANAWDVTKSLHLKGRGNKHTRINFYKFTDDSTETTTPISEPCLSHAKAVVRFLHTNAPIKAIGQRVCALKAVCYALEQNGKNSFADLTGADLNIAAQYIQRMYAESVAYKIGQRIEQLARLITHNKLVNIPLSWVNFLPRPQDTQRVGAEFDKRRTAKLPSEAALDALPAVFRMASDPCDVLITSCAAMLCSAPERINELMLLPLECEVTGQYKGEQCYGLRWWPSKGADPQIKWIVTSMRDVVRQAVENLKRVTAPARKIASWYEQTTNRLFLPSHMECYRAFEFLSTQQVAEIVGLSCHESAANWLKYHKLPAKGRPLQVRFADLEKTIIAMLPSGFPYVLGANALKYSDALMVVRKGELHGTRNSYNCMIEPLSVDRVNQGLGARKDIKSIFARFSFSEPNGSPIKVTSHQFRHYLNTLAQLGGLSEVDIAKWSGRRDIRQNATYNHVSSEDALQELRRAVGDSSLIFGPLGRLPKSLVTRAQFASLKLPTAHTTALGFCIHDFIMAPCQLHADCINCTELVCLKGDERRNEVAQELLSESRLLLKQAEEEGDECSFGVGRWIEHLRGSVERYEQLCAILKDPSLPIGTWISFGPPPNPVLTSGQAAPLTLEKESDN